MNDDRKRQVATTKARYGEDHYKKISAKGKKLNSETAKLAVMKRWYPERFDENNKLKKEYQ